MKYFIGLLIMGIEIMVIGIKVIILLLKPLPTVVVPLNYAERVLHLKAMKNLAKRTAVVDQCNFPLMFFDFSSFYFSSLC